MSRQPSAWVVVAIAALLAAGCAGGGQQAASTNTTPGGWRLRSTPHGALLQVPVDRTIDYSDVVFGQTADLTNRQIELTQNVEACVTTSDTRRTTINTSNGDNANWCERGLHVHVEGPLQYVQRVVHDLTVTVASIAP
jgi:hypothetical protein